MKPYQLPPHEVVTLFKTDPIHGLTTEQAQERLKKYGINMVPEKPLDSWLIIFLRQFQNPLIYILLCAAFIIFLFGDDHLDAFIISFILLFNAVIGTIQEGRTRNILASLRTFMSVEAVVMRDGISMVIDAHELVPGDVVMLHEGQRIPADIRLVVANNLLVDEALLTGESIEILKNADYIMSAESPLADQKNMAFKGTYILAGSGKGVVVATGKESEIGKIQHEAQEIQTDMPLKQELARLSQWILVGVLGICAMLLIVGLLTGKPFQELLVTITALFICVVPEGLPVVLTLVLAAGVYRMAKRQVLVKRMQAVEALGRTDVIVVDKTGTLTRNEMMVSELLSAGKQWHVSGEGYKPVGGILHNGTLVDSSTLPDAIHQLAKAVLLLCNAQITYNEAEDRYDIKGDPTEAALGLLAQKVGFDADVLHQEYQLLYEIPFDSRLKYHAGFYAKNDDIHIFIVGAPETIVAWCPQCQADMNDALNTMLARGLRVVMVAQKVVPRAQFEEAKLRGREALSQLVQSGLQGLGICGIQDAIRPEVKEAITQTRAAGLEIIMATGDHKKTALHVAKEVGIFREGDEAIDGSDLAQLPDAALQKRLEMITVYSRVSPSHKLRIIRQFHKDGQMVAMTGDGVNDVPSLAAADIGIAMGRIGTEVAREASDIVLLDDSFVHIVTAVKEGRHIFYTLRRVVLYFFATNVGEILIMIFALFVYFIHPTFPLPLTAAQILWLNLITDGFLDTALSMEGQEKDLLTNPRFKAKRHLVDRAMVLESLFMAVPMAVGSLLIYSYYHETDLAYARTMALVSMALFQWFNAWNCRSETLSIFQLGLFSNKWLIVTTVFVFGLQVGLVYTPFLQKIFKTVPITLDGWLLLLAVASSVLVLEEMRKFIVRHIANRRNSGVPKAD